MIAGDDEYTPTPAISHAILTYNRGRSSGLADGVVITPSHNPPTDGGFKYNPPHGGPAGTPVTQWIESRANEHLERGLRGVHRISYARALAGGTTRRHDFLDAYTRDLASVIDFDVIRAANIALGVDPLGEAGVHYWARIAQRYRLDLTEVNDTVDPAFGFMSLDWDGQIRIDPSSPYAMLSLIALKDRFRIAFAFRPRSRGSGRCRDPVLAVRVDACRQAIGAHGEEVRAEITLHGDPPVGGSAYHEVFLLRAPAERAKAPVFVVRYDATSP